MRPALPQRQHGAMTLISALILIVIVIALLGTVQRMAASDISDTALHTDGIEALFLAETGLERAAWRYAGGTPCAGLAGDTDTVGRGDFLVDAAALVGNLCRVRVSGSVTSTTVDNMAWRTVEGAFSRAGFSGWAVGDLAGVVAVLLAWDGSSWVQPGPYLAVPPANLNDVFCVTGSDCWAVGDNFNGAANINHWDGTTWSNIAAPALPGKHLNSVYCVATDDCWAVGQKDGKNANINHWDGTVWTNIAAPALLWQNLNSVTCVTTDDCWAVGNKNGKKSANINHWDGGSWTNTAAPDVLAEDLNSVYCAASDDCWAVGNKNGKKSANINHWDGGSWTNTAAPDVLAENLNSVYCVASDDCWAVGNDSGGENINHWDGSGWNRAGPYAGVANENLNAVTMVSATEGYIAGANSVTAKGDGSSWNGLPAPAGLTLNSASIVSGGGGGGGVKLVQWTEVIQ